MKHSDFEIGCEFKCGESKWKCTDKGTRTIQAICIDEKIEFVQSDGDNLEILCRNATPEDFFGPPYKVDELVFDEYDFEGCERV